MARDCQQRSRRRDETPPRKGRRNGGWKIRETEETEEEGIGEEERLWMEKIMRVEKDILEQGLVVPRGGKKKTEKGKKKKKGARDLQQEKAEVVEVFPAMAGEGGEVRLGWPREEDEQEGEGDDGPA